MKVAVDQRRGQPALLDRGEALRQLNDKTVQQGAVAGVEPSAGAVDYGCDRRRGRRRPPVGSAGAEQLGCSANPVGLEANQDVDHLKEDGALCVVQVLTRDFVHQDARTFASEDARRRVAGEQAEDVSLMAKNGGRTLSQSGPRLVGRRQRLDRLQLRICSGLPAGSMPFVAMLTAPTRDRREACLAARRSCAWRHRRSCQPKARQRRAPTPRPGR